MTRQPSPSISSVNRSSISTMADNMTNKDRLLLTGDYNNYILWNMGPIKQTSSTGERYVSYLEAVVRANSLLLENRGSSSGFRIYICDEINQDSLSSILKENSSADHRLGALNGISDFEDLINNGVSLTWDGTPGNLSTLSDVYANKSVKMSYTYINNNLGKISKINKHEFDILSIILHPGYTDDNVTDGMGVFFLYNKVPLNDVSTSHQTYPIVIDYIENPYLYVVMNPIPGQGTIYYFDLNVMQWNLDYDYYIYKDLARMCYSGELNKIQNKESDYRFMTEWYPNSFFPLKRTNLAYDENDTTRLPITIINPFTYNVLDENLKYIELEIGNKDVNFEETISTPTFDLTDNSIYAFVYIGTLKDEVYTIDNINSYSSLVTGYSPNVIFDPMKLNATIGYYSEDNVDQDTKCNMNKSIFDTGILFCIYDTEPTTSRYSVSYRCVNNGNLVETPSGENYRFKCSAYAVNGISSLSILIDIKNRKLMMASSFGVGNGGTYNAKDNSNKQALSFLDSVQPVSIVFGSTYPRNFYLNTGYKDYILERNTGNSDLRRPGIVNSPNNVKWKSLIPYTHTYNFSIPLHDNPIILPYDLFSDDTDSFFLEIEVPNTISYNCEYYIFIGDGIGFSRLTYDNTTTITSENNTQLEVNGMNNGQLFLFSVNQERTYPTFTRYKIENRKVTVSLGEGITGGGALTIQHANIEKLIYTIARNAEDPYVADSPTFVGSREQLAIKKSTENDKQDINTDNSNTVINNNMKTIAIHARYLGEDTPESKDLGYIKLNFGPTSIYSKNMELIDDFLTNDNGGGGNYPLMILVLVLRITAGSSRPGAWSAIKKPSP